jgi:hypothetical protein
VDAALKGIAVDYVTAALAERDAAALAARANDLDPDRARSVRRWFASYGSCSITEPVEDLVSLGLLTKPAE